MSLLASTRSAAGLFRMDAEKRHHGLQLAAAVLLACLASMVAGLPEQFWAVMSTLIVMRPNSASTFDAGWDRTRGTLLGVACGLLGVYLEHHGAPALATTLALVALLAFASATGPAMRSAPVAALIILAAGGIAGHSALQVAALRVVQILIGVGVAMLVTVASSRYRAGARLRAGCAGLLERMARTLQQPARRARADEAEAEKASAAVRQALDRLTLLGGSADRESRLFRRASSEADGRHHRRIAGLTARIVQDITVFRRVLDAVDAEAQRQEAARAASSALACVADMLAGRRKADLDALRGFAPESGGNAAHPLLAAPLHLLREDLRRLVSSVENPAA
jgi:uncharacterized membrane protein YccC